MDGSYDMMEDQVVFDRDRLTDDPSLAGDNDRGRRSEASSPV